MKLREFYNTTFYLNVTETGGWAPIYYGVFSKVIQENQYKKVAEVGIGFGTHALQVLKNTDVTRLYLVDPMKNYPNDNFSRDIMSHDAEIPGNNFNEMASLIAEKLEPYKERYTWFRKESLTVTNEEIPNKSLDCVFVDGDHTYSGVFNDLNFWWEKVRVGGQLLGDDYWLDSVAAAVKTFSELKGLTVEFLSREDNPSYKIYRFKKDS